MRRSRTWCTGSASHCRSRARPRRVSRCTVQVGPATPGSTWCRLGEAGGHDPVQGRGEDERTVHGQDSAQVAARGQPACQGETVRRPFGQQRQHDPLVE